MKTYTMKHFDPDCASPLEFADEGLLMFSYVEPSFLHSITAEEIFTIRFAVTEENVSMSVYFKDGDDPEDCQLIIKEDARRDMTAWIMAEVNKGVQQFLMSALKVGASL